MQTAAYHCWLPLVALVALAGCDGQRSTSTGQRVSLVVSGDTAGWIAPCACSAKQSGGLARRATFVANCRKTDDVVPLDVGGAPSGVSAYDVAKFEFVLAGEAAMGVAAHNVGAAEAALGRETLSRLATEKKVPFVSANTSDAAGRPLALPLRIVEAGGRRLAIVGVLSPKYATAELLVDDPAKAVLQTLAAVKGGYDSVIVLAYLPTEELEALAGALPEVDVVVGGPTLQTVEPRRVGPTLLAAVTNKGKFVARLRSGESSKSKSWQGEIVELDALLADDAGQLANLEKFHQMLVRRDFTAAETSFAPQLPERLPENYHLAGTAACRACHEGDCRLWESTDHAHAWTTLEARASQGDSYCQQCHTTGYGLPGGFVSLAASVDRVSVGCESCHGPASAHAARPETHTTFVARDQCLRCHDRENSPAFVYADYWDKIRHGPDAEASQAQSAPREIE